MPGEPLRLTKRDIRKVEKQVDEVMLLGKEIRTLFSKYNDEEFDIGWEVDSAVDAFSVFSSRWTTEILATLYIAGAVSYTHLTLPTIYSV